ncbi:restriction endonuclease subunit S [Pseudonocardia asaccharolytica]|uniref:restriction endonuclease subunit S n=1 Tax=Pseudonocardia asaccharolytica TaxID=54010 RepID=UPI0011BFC298|nr:restriction endonuclease subunit S [Pseudonocardia asaccharolytica]
MPSLEYFKKQVFSRDLSDYRVVEPGEFAYATIHLDEGAIGIAKERCLISPMYTVFKVTDKRILAPYLLQYLKSPRAMAEYPRLGKGSVHRRRSISLASLGSMRIPVRPLNQQIQVVNSLDKVVSLRDMRQTALALLDDLKQSIFLSLFGDPQTNPHDWPTVRLSSATDPDDRINYGVVQPGEHCPDGTPMVRVGNLVSGRVDRSNLKRIDPTVDAKHARSRLRGTEILVGCVGSIGSIAIASESDKGSNIARAIARVPVSSPHRRTYLAEHLRSRSTQKYFTNEVRVVAQPTLNIKQLSEAVVMDPPDSLQREFHRQALAIDKLRQQHSLHLEELNALFASLQNRAFRGDPPDGATAQMPSILSYV